MFKDAMVDLETLGKKPGCAILSIGAVMFDPHGLRTTNVFQANICLFSSVMAGFKIEEDTVEWWKKQKPEAQARLSEHTVPVKDVLGNFQMWWREAEAEKFWCQGLTFDLPILEEAYNMVGLQLPWFTTPYAYAMGRDTRTVYDTCKFDCKTLVRKGVYHNALDDAIYQVECVQEALKNSEKTNMKMKEALVKLACLGNGGQFGNSEGNTIAKNALA